MIRRKDSILIILITVFIVTPAVLMLVAYLITGNPSLRPLAITLERLIEAGQIEDKSLIVALVEIGGKARTASTEATYQTALETAFSRLNAEVQVKFRHSPESSEVRITYLVGESRIGPFPEARAAEGVLAATEAAHMVVARRKAMAKEQERRDSLDRNGFWQRLTN
ncbi:hypothetical protein [Celeribacter halophilus]|uniref:Uncharacterized protein n=1 Tax=Celeribacter halophilus TaxID=576117 RepID=A0A1I3WMI8_9RHOB|nr:hypothetical protein [Celeribacter halophilus]PZX06045.1 hypothetical protein LX82_03454 [Celeribacter halophilus]SFK08738.1 hypothetical protein SAMN04488138_12811 [Celeribacter halophilus]